MKQIERCLAGRKHYKSYYSYKEIVSFMKRRHKPSKISAEGSSGGGIHLSLKEQMPSLVQERRAGVSRGACDLTSSSSPSCRLLQAVSLVPLITAE